MVLQKIPEWFYGTSVGKKMRENDARQVAQERQEHVDAIKRLRSEGKRELAKLDPRLAKATKALAEAKTAAKATEEEFNGASNAKRASVSSIKSGITQHEKALCETADPAIDEFIASIQRQWSKRRRPASRVEAFRVARGQAEQLKLMAYTDVIAELEKIGKTIPAIDDTIQRHKSVLAEAEYYDDDRPRPWIHAWMRDPKPEPAVHTVSVGVDRDQDVAVENESDHNKTDTRRLAKPSRPRGG